MTGWRLAVGFVVFLLALQTESRKVIFCKPGKNEHFIQQIGKCKKCDRCPKGWGYDTNDEVGLLKKLRNNSTQIRIIKL